MQTWFVLMGEAILYLMGWFKGLLKLCHVAAVTGLEADYQLHQIRFLLTLIMITSGTIALNFDWHVEEIFTSIAWVQPYFLVSDVGRQWRTMPNENVSLMIICAANLLLILTLLTILVTGDRRLKSRPR